MMAFRLQKGPTASSISLTALALTSILTPALALNPYTSKGCFSSGDGLQFQGTYMYQSPGWCQQQCVNQNKPAMGLTNGGDCWCGSLLPPVDAQTDDSKCSSPCLGFGQQNCGGNGAFSVYLTGTQANVANAQGGGGGGGGGGNNNNNPPPPPSSAGNNAPSTILSQGPPVTETLAPSTVTAPGQSTTIPASVVTVGGATQVITLPGSTPTQPDAGPDQASNSATATPVHKTSTGTKVGIAVGIVIAVLVLLAIVGFAVFYFLKKKRADYGGSQAGAGSGNLVRNNTLHSHSTSGGFGGSNWGGNGSASDSRLDPNMVDTRRGSMGSVFDDGEDYSRRILKVTNPSG